MDNKIFNEDIAKDFDEDFDPIHFVGDNATFSVSGDTNDLIKDLKLNYDNIPVLATRGLVINQHVAIPLPIGRESTLKLVHDAIENDEAVFIVSQMDDDLEEPTKVSDLFTHGVLAKIIRVVEPSEDRRLALIQTFKRMKLESVKRSKGYLRGVVTDAPELAPHSEHVAINIIGDKIVEDFRKVLDNMPDEETQDVRFTLQSIRESRFAELCYIMQRIPGPKQQKLDMLAEDNLLKRLEMLANQVDMTLQKLLIRVDMMRRTHIDMSQAQKEAFIQQQIRTLQDELGPAPEDEDIAELQARSEAMDWTQEANNHFDKELRKLERYNPNSPEYAIQYNYLDTLLNLPWNKVSSDEISLSKIERILNRDHSGLDKVKERIIEQMAVLKLRGDMKVPILCLYGPPGVGKTSLGHSIAEALGRQYQRISLGGLHDEAEIRGHRRTYIGAMPGRFISALQKAGTNNPVIVLDEIDKIGTGVKGDPSTALLEVLDPEQNMKFHDNFVDIDYDLSKVLFIATANSLDTISAPLRDRMEIIEINGYIKAEKVTIAHKHLVPKLLIDHGFNNNEITFDRDALGYIVDRYTLEAGVRQLEKKIGGVLRKIARLKASGKKFESLVTKEKVREYLGPETVDPEMYENNDTPGVVTGLAWTSVGGEILFIESSLAPGKGEKLTLTGNLGDVMKESAVIALQYLKANAESLGVDSTKFEKNDVHVHVPEGAIPKDGPSAGIAMVTSLASSFTKRKVRSKLAMTGEITLRGKVLPVGGIKEKILAAKRAGITDIILCRANKKDIDQIQKRYIQGLTFHFVDSIKEVLDFALV